MNDHEEHEKYLTVILPAEILFFALIGEKTMNTQDFNVIESALDIVLPNCYREFMSLQHGEEFEGNSDTDLWDLPTALIERNLELRSGKNLGGAKPWPSHLYFIGDPLTTCANAIALSDERFPVWWIDHGNIEAESSGEISANFKEWAQEIVDNLI